MDVYAENLDKLEIEALKKKINKLEENKKTEVVVDKCSNCVHMNWMNEDLNRRLNQVKEDKWFDIDKIVKGRSTNYETEISILKSEIEHLQIEKQVYEADLKDMKDTCDKEIANYRIYSNRLATDVSYYAKLSEYYRLRLIETTTRMTRIIKYIDLNDECPRREDFVMRSKIVEENEKIKADNKL